jgi:outer membrane protein assembly factor BamD (BamD/ComL family)
LVREIDAEVNRIYTTGERLMNKYKYRRAINYFNRLPDQYKKVKEYKEVCNKGIGYAKMMESAFK